MADISSLQSVQSNHEKYKDLFKNSGKNDTISTDTFFSLLMAEMSNQDPLEPTSNTEFVSQMAQFTALQAQQDNLKYSMSNYAAGLVGKTLTMNAQSDDGTLLSGVCTGVSISGSDVKVVVDGKQYDLSAVKAISDTVSKGTLHTMTEALGYVGKEVTVKVLGDDGKFYYAKGKVELYLRPETAQGIFVNFMNIQRTTRKKVPFGVAQVGKSFRNEITPGNFIFRVREFEQMELEFFCKPGTDLDWFYFWKDYCKKWLLSLGINEENLRLRDHDKEELCFYSKATTDFEYLFPFGWGELWGVADRTDYDLTQHIKTSGQKMEYFDPETNEKYVPYVIEPSLGVERLFLAVITEAYDEEQLEDGTTRNVMHFHPYLAPVKAAVLPLSKKLADKAGEIADELSKYFCVDYDDAGAIGKRYRRQDEIGTPFCITYDFDSVEDGCVTVRERDSMKQERMPIADVKKYIEDRIAF